MHDPLAHARAEAKRLSTEALAVVGNPRIDNARKKAALDKLEPEIKHWSEEVTALASVEEARRKMFETYGDLASVGGGGPAYVGDHTNGEDLSALAGLDDGGRMLTVPPPAVRMGLKSARQMFDSARQLKSYALDVKVSDSAGNPASAFPQRILPPTTVHREPNRIAELFSWFPSTSPVVEYFVQSAKATAGVVAEGALKPGSDITTPMQLAKAAKIAGWVDVTEEALADFGGFLALVENDLGDAVIDSENLQLLSGTGTAPANITGMLNTTGILTRAYPATPPPLYSGLDELDRAQTDLRNGAAFAQLQAWVMSPTTFSSLRRVKDTQGRFLLNSDPTAEDAQKVWGKQVVLTTQIADGTALGGDFADACRGFIRQGLHVVSSSGTTGAGGASSFKSNIVTILAEERVGMYVQRPASLIKVTGLPTT